jgi:hypothetical protein
MIQEGNLSRRFKSCIAHLEQKMRLFCVGFDTFYLRKVSFRCCDLNHKILENIFGHLNFYTNYIILGDVRINGVSKEG